MALIDFTSDLPRHGRPIILDTSAVKAPYFILASLAASLLVIGVAFYLRGQTTLGWRLAAENIQRFSFFFFLTVMAVGPCARLFPSLGLAPIARERHKLILGFATAYAVSLLCWLAPYNLAGQTASLLHRIPATTTAFVLFGFGALAMMLLSAHEGAVRFLGKRLYRLMDRSALVYFWALFAFAAVDHLIGPHRTDGFFAFSLVLLLAALLVRFADAFIQERRAVLSAWAKA